MRASTSVAPGVREVEATPADLLPRAVAGQLLLVVARDDQHKADVLRSLSPAAPGAGATADAAAIQPFPGWVVPAHVNGAHAAAPLAWGADGDAAARGAIAALRRQADELLDERGVGRIAHLVARLRTIGEQLAAARAADAEARREFEAVSRLVAERERVTAERGRSATFLGLWPDWLRLQGAREAADALQQAAGLAPDTDQRWAAVVARGETAATDLAAAREHLAELRREAGRVVPAADPDLLQDAEEVVRLCGELPAYRDRLLELAAARARLAEHERVLAAERGRPQSERGAARLAAIKPACAADLRQWQERLRAARSERAAAGRRLDTAQASVRELCARVHDQLQRTADAADDPADRRWRSTWRLRAALEELWDVQSRAEAASRELTELETALGTEHGVRPWTPPPILLRLLLGLAALAAVAAPSVPRGALATALVGSTAVLLALSGALFLRLRWFDVLAQRRADRVTHLSADMKRLRRVRDAAWARAAQLNEQIEEGRGELALEGAVTLEAVEASEQELLTRLRAGGPPTPLMCALLALLEAQEEEQRAASALDDGETRLGALERDWQAWRSEADLPSDLDVERLDDWLAELSRVSSAGAARDTARQTLQALEPLVAAFEGEARALLARLGEAVTPQLCGRALAGKLTRFESRARQDAEGRSRQDALALALRQAEERVAAVDAEVAAAQAARQALLGEIGAADETDLRERIAGVRRARQARAHAGEIEAALDAALAGVPDGCARLAGGTCDLWQADIRRCDARLAELDRGIDAAAQRRRDLERSGADDPGTALAEARLGREEVLADLAELARAWKLRTLTAAFLEDARREYLAAEQDALLRVASRTVNALTDGRYTELLGGRQSQEVSLLDREGRHLPLTPALGEPLLTQVRLSLLFAAARYHGGGSRPVVLDDILASVPPESVIPVVREIAACVRAHPVCYVTTRAGRAGSHAALADAVALCEIDAP